MDVQADAPRMSDENVDFRVRHVDQVELNGIGRALFLCKCIRNRDTITLGKRRGDKIMIAADVFSEKAVSGLSDHKNI